MLTKQKKTDAVQESGKQSVSVNAVAESTQNKEAVKSAAKTSKASSKRMDTAPAVESQNREKAGKVKKKV